MFNTNNKKEPKRYKKNIKKKPSITNIKQKYNTLVKYEKINTNHKTT